MKETNMSHVFITGATSGIGLETAKLYAEKKFPLILNGRRMDRLQAIEKELSGKTQVALACFDVSDKEAVNKWFSENTALVSKVSILVNNAGLARGTEPLQKGNVDDWEEMIDTNIKGLLYITRRVVPAMLENKSGHIVNLGSVAGRWTYAGGAVYCATKFSVRAISEALRIDVLGSGVRVTNIEPGMVETEFAEVRFRDKEKAKQVYKGMQPLSGKDIAETILWATDRPPHVNIQELVIFPTDQASIRDVHRE
jgi:3-hydroxy acid dehydrogenase/malonic semialdehyde reductase